MTSDQKPQSGDRAILHSIADVFSGHIHEVNNKLGSIILNSEILVKANPESESPAADIIRNATDLLEMTRDLESALPGKLGGETSLRSMLVLASRLLRGALRKRRIELVLPDLNETIPAPKDGLASFATMLMIPLAFPRFPSGQSGTLEVRFSDSGTSHHWKVELNPPMEMEPGPRQMLDNLCRCYGWEIEFGIGRLTIVAPQET